MKTINATTCRRILLATVGAATFCAAALGAAHADEAEKSRSNHFSWSFNFGFNNHIHYGNNRTKGTGVIREESRAVANFSRLVLALPATVTVSQGATESLAISTDDNLLPLMTTRVEGDEFIIDPDKNRGFNTKHEIKIRLTVNSLSAITIKGSGDVIGDQLKSDKLEIAIVGSGDVRYADSPANVSRTVRGSGSIEAL